MVQIRNRIKYFSAAGVLLLSSLFLPAAEQNQEQADYTALSDFLNALAIVKKVYVDAEKVTDAKLFKAAISGMLKELDPYCVYETEDVLEDTRKETEGEMVGIGVSVLFHNNMLSVESILPEGPAAKAGLKPGDLIKEIDGSLPENLEDGAKKLRGNAGEPVRLKIYRPAADSDMELTVVRALVNLPSVTGAKILDQKTGSAYLRILQFGTKTPGELDVALADLSQQGMKRLIIDLRNNPGGLLISARDASSRFLTAGKPVLSVEGREKKDRIVHKSISCKSYPELPLVILVNEMTASAAEIMTACLQDHKRAAVIGTTTFGKGVVQTLIPFKEKKEALRITTAKYYTPSRRIIQDHGIEPDISVPLSPAHRNNLMVQLNSHPGTVLPRIPRAVRDTQLERALEIQKALHLLKEK